MRGIPTRTVLRPGGTLVYEGLHSWMGYRVHHDPTLPWLLAAALKVPVIVVSARGEVDDRILRQEGVVRIYDILFDYDDVLMATLSMTSNARATQAMSVMTPETSRPMMSLAPFGGGYLPAACNRSARLIPAATTSIRTSPG